MLRRVGVANYLRFDPDHGGDDDGREGRLIDYRMDESLPFLAQALSG
jgi:hypothetical protein